MKTKSSRTTLKFLQLIELESSGGRDPAGEFEHKESIEGKVEEEEKKEGKVEEEEEGQEHVEAAGFLQIWMER